MSRVSAIVKLLVVLGAVNALRCSGQATPSLVDSLGAAPDITRAQSDAPIVVVATVSSNTIVLRDKASARFPDVVLDLHAVRCELENVIRGSRLDKEVTFYYFAEADTSTHHNPYYKFLFRAVPDRRYMFFLKSDDGVLRSVGDVGDYSVSVFTGSHRGEHLNNDFGKAIADVILKRGRGADEHQVAGNIEKSVRIANEFGSRLYDIQLLKELGQSRRAVRSEACRVLMKWFYSQYGCLFDIMNDPEESPENRNWARSWLSDAEASDRRLLATLANPDELDLPKMGLPATRSRQLEELTSMLSSPNSEVRVSACSVIHRLFPNQPLSCP